MRVVGCHILRLGRLFIDAPFVSITHHQLSLSLFSTGSHIMSAVPSTSTTSHTNFASIFNTALEKYNRKTKQDLAKHPLLPRLQSCHSPEAILTVLREQTPEFDQSQNSDDGVTNWVTPTVNVLYSFSATLGGVVGLVNIRISPYHILQTKFTFQAFPPANIIFTGIGVLLLVGVFRCSLASGKPGSPTLYKSS